MKRLFAALFLLAFGFGWGADLLWSAKVPKAPGSAPKKRKKKKETKPASDLLAGIPSVPTPAITISGQTLFALTDDDYVHPAFSPDGKRLAYSRVVVRENTELTEVLVRDLASGAVRRLVDAEGSAKYAVYKSFVNGISWTDDKTLEVRFHDGDVDETQVQFDVPSGKILKSDFTDGEGFEFGLSPQQKIFMDKALAAFPGIRREVLETTFHNSGNFPVPGRGYVVQKRYAKVDNHIWLFDVENGEMIQLLEVPQESWAEMSGGFVFQDALLFLLFGQDKAAIVKYQDAEVVKLAEFEKGENQWLRLEVEHSSSERVIFRVIAHASYEQGDNPLFIYDSEGLKRVTEFQELYDVTVDPQGRLICFVAWEGDQRHLHVKELK